MEKFMQKPASRASKTEFRQRVGARIRARRVELGLSQAGLARKLPGGVVEGSQISRWERGDSFPSYSSMLALARALGVTEELLLCGCSDADHGKKRYA
jgi:transcriptional regulator with XRE-family HTH domain